MIVSEIYETMAGDLYGVVLNEDIKIIRIVKINDRELTPDFSGEQEWNSLPSIRMTSCPRKRCGGVLNRTAVWWRPSQTVTASLYMAITI